jgi:hypothetical protein
VNVPVPVLAAQAEHVEPLGGDDFADRLADMPDDFLELEVLVAAEVANDVLLVCARATST